MTLCLSHSTAQGTSANTAIPLRKMHTHSYAECVSEAGAVAHAGIFCILNHRKSRWILQTIPLQKQLLCSQQLAAAMARTEEV